MRYVVTYEKFGLAGSIPCASLVEAEKVAARLKREKAYNIEIQTLEA